MEIDLRHHQDGSYIIEIRVRDQVREVDVTDIVHDIVVDKLRDMREKLQLEQKYRDWLVESAQETSKSLSTIAIRYETAHRRLKETTEVLSEMIELWREKKPIELSLKSRIKNIQDQNKHYMENDSGVSRLPLK